jgi:cob(I)alamin adenosyltransferase
VQRDLFAAGAELATDPSNRHKLTDGVSRVTAAMVDRLEGWIDEVEAEVGMPTEFIVPGGSEAAAALDVARTVVRRAERRCVSYARGGELEGSRVVPYLNRLADYLYMLARAAEDDWVPSREKEEG